MQSYCFSYLNAESQWILTRDFSTIIDLFTNWYTLCCLQEYEEFRQKHLALKAQKEEIEKRREAAVAVNAPAQKEIDKLKKTKADKTDTFRDVVRWF